MCVPIFMSFFFPRFLNEEKSSFFIFYCFFCLNFFGKFHSDFSERTEISEVLSLLTFCFSFFFFFCSCIIASAILEAVLEGEWNCVGRSSEMSKFINRN